MKNNFDRILDARNSRDIEKIISDFGNAIQWVPLGNNPGNCSVLSSLADPFDGITERITNAMDAMIELSAELTPTLKESRTPREAVEKIYHFSGGFLKDADMKYLNQLATNIKVKFFDGDEPKRPTVEIHDQGIGQHPSDFPQTLLSLNADYKVSKFYLIGAFGQGGQTSFSFCKYGLVISKKHPKLLRPGQEDLIGWSIVRYRNPSNARQFYKKGVWEYCVNSSDGKILTINPRDCRFAFESGTIIKLISYNIPKGVSNVLHASGTGYQYLSQSLFDPVLPIKLYEGRKNYPNKDKALYGLAPRLWHGGRGEKVEIKINNTYEIDLAGNGKIRLNYWILNPIEEGVRWTEIRKGLVVGNSAIFFTLNGQRHDFESSIYLRDNANLKWSHEYVIVHIDCDFLTDYAKLELITSTRDRFKEVELKDIIMDEVIQHLKNDRNLLAFESERKNKIINARSKKDVSNIKKLLGKYINKNPMLKDLLIHSGKNKSETEIEQRERDEKTNDEDEIQDIELELPKLLDNPTYLRITNRREPIPVEKGRNALIRLETNAIDSYLDGENIKKLHITHSKDLTKEKSISKLRQGKISYHIYCPHSVRIGQRELIKFILDIPMGQPLVIEREVICVEPIKRKKVMGEDTIPEAHIQAIRKGEELWASLGYTESSVGEIHLTGGKDSSIIVSLDNCHFKSILKNSNIKDEGVKIIEDRYAASISLYLLLREVDKKKGKIPKDFDETPESPEMQRLAQTVAQLALPGDIT